MTVVIGIDPHKQTHQAVAVDDREDELSHLEVRATKTQVGRLVRWAAPFEERTWAVESAGGLGYLLAHQLVAAGEHVVDVPATLASRVRLLGSGRSLWARDTGGVAERGSREIEGVPLRCLVCDNDVFEDRIEPGYAGTGTIMDDPSARLRPRRR